MSITVENRADGDDLRDTDEPQELPLSTLLSGSGGAPGELSEPTSARVVVSDGEEITLLVGRADDTVDVLTSTAALITRNASEKATPVNDPARRERVLRLTLSRLADRYRTLRQAQRETEHLADTLERIRDQAVEWYDSGNLDRDELDDFLSTFGLTPYTPRVRIAYTITGSYVVEDSTPDEARGDANGYLTPDLGELDRVEDDSSDFTVTVEAADNIT